MSTIVIDPRLQDPGVPPQRFLDDGGLGAALSTDQLVALTTAQYP